MNSTPHMPSCDNLAGIISELVMYLTSLVWISSQYMPVASFCRSFLYKYVVAYMDSA